MSAPSVGGHRLNGGTPARLEPVDVYRMPGPGGHRPPSPRPAPKEPRRGWARRIADDLGKIVANLATLAVAAIAGYISWLHLYALGMAQAETAGINPDQEKLAAQLTPFAIDGMILVGTLMLRQARMGNRPAHWAAYAAVVLGVAGTIAGNVASAPDSTTARLLAAAPPIAFLLGAEALLGRPLQKNLWDLIKGWWSAWRGSRARRDPKPSPAPVEAPVVRKPIRADVAPPLSGQPAERPAASPAPRPRPVAAASPRKRAERPSRPVSAPVPFDDYPRDSEGRVVGSSRFPAREVDGVVLTEKALKADGRRRLSAWLAEGEAAGLSPEEARQGLGARVGREYDPPMSERWGQILLKEMTEPVAPGLAGDGEA